MKQFYLFLLVSLAFSITQAQIVDIPDAAFKNLLINTNCADFIGNEFYSGDVDINDDGEIQLSEALAVYGLKFENDSDVISLEGIEDFINIKNFTFQASTSTYNELEVSPNFSQNVLLEKLVFNHIDFIELELSQNVNLKSLTIFNSDLATLDISNNVLLEDLGLSSMDISAIDVTQNENLVNLTISYTNLSAIDLSNNFNLIELRLNDNSIVVLDLSQNPLLEYVYVLRNDIADLDLSNNINLETLNCDSNNFETLDLSKNINLSLGYFRYNSNFKNLIIKMKSENFNSNIHFESNPNLQYVCTDESLADYFSNRVANYGYTECVVNSYCSFVPSDEFYTIEGQNKLDLEMNGCNMTDINFPNLKFNISGSSINGDMISNSSGIHYIPVQDGIHTINPALENPEYFIVNPTSLVVDFPTDTSPYNQSFCITPNGDFDDLQIIVLPIEQARPGFDTDYKILYKNKGTTTMSGTLELIYNENDDLMDLVSATPNMDSDVANVLTWSYSDLLPFETREILVTFNLNTPTETPPLNGGDSLGLVANIFPLTTDEIPRDNNFQLKQIVVNSYDPNDKTCLQGEIITPEQVGKYVYYMIRFENTGTASAVNVVVKDEIDVNKFDVSTLIPLNSSHDFVTNIKEDNVVEFIFEDINLPFDDANNDGYVVFKIKTLQTLQLGDTFANDAEIYFDYNAPIITNDEETTVAVLSVAESTIQDAVKIYPNPVNNILFIESKNTIEAISIYDVNGRQLQSISIVGYKQNTEINTSTLSKGIYFVKIKTEIGMQTTKIIKN